MLSFPRRRESSVFNSFLDTGFRRYDVKGVMQSSRSFCAMKKRYLVDNIRRDLDEKMVFIGGARQVGKTSMATYIADNHYKSSDYLNWDVREDRKNIIQAAFKGDAEIILFDEIHKYKDWKNYLKGQFDKHRKDYKILVPEAQDSMFTGGAAIRLWEDTIIIVCTRFPLPNLWERKMILSLSRR